MQESLFLLILMGQCYIFTCALYKYHLIEEKKNWDEAQTYCKEKHTDLATLFNKADVERLCNSADNSGNAWIGLYSIPGQENRRWHWSLPGVDFNNTDARWASEEPNDKKGLENCVRMDKPNEWKDVKCTEKYTFICYNEKNPSNNRFILIEIPKMWQEAQSYCREYHTDLVSGVAQLDDAWFKNKTMYNNYLWIGLFRDTWRWSNGNNSSFRYWESVQESNVDLQDNGKTTCAMTVDSSGKWGTDKCDEQKRFFCYEDKVILIKENKTWDEALFYCREKYRGLVSITNPEEQKWVVERARNASTPHVWLGLRYTCTLDFWFWVSDEVVTYNNWASEGDIDECDTSGAMGTQGQHKWFKKNDNEKFNFMCSKF